MINVLQGGHVQDSFPITAGQTFTPGQVGEVQTTGAVSVATGASTKVKGLFVETAPSAGSYDETSGNSKATLVIGEAVVETDQLTSGITFSPTNQVYHDSSGKLTTSGALTEAVGQALNDSSSNGVLRMFWYGLRSGVV